MLVLPLGGCGGGGGSGTVVDDGDDVLPANILPAAVFTATPENGTAPLDVDFDGNTSFDADGTIALWSWTFGDGSTGTGPVVQHTYASAGTYTATLTVTDDRGGTGTASLDITVDSATPPPPPPPANALPVAVIQASTLEGLLTGVPPQLTVTFDGRTSYDTDGAIAGYRWDFDNDGIPDSDVAAPAWIFDASGQHEVSLTVIDDDGGNASTSVTVYAAAPGDVFAIAGTVGIPDTVFADCDTADSISRGTIAGCNQGFDDAQSLPAPAIVGGHASVADDADDYFAVSLAGGETLSLSVAASNASNDLDLRLYDAGRNLVDESAQPDAEQESLVAPAAGNYFIRVTAAVGASNYVLSIGTATTSLHSGADEEVIDNEFIIHFAALRIPWRHDAQAEARTAELGLAIVAGNGDRPMLARDTSRPGKVRRGQDPAMQSTLRRLRQAADVALAEPNRVRRTLDIDATDTYYPMQWNLGLSRFPAAWEMDTVNRGDGSIVAVIDTGILEDHPDLAGQLVAGHDFVSDPANANDGDGADTDPADPGGDSLGGRSIFHGTHIAGIIAARTRFTPADGSNTGMAGAAPLAKVMPVRAIGRHGGTSYDIIQAIRYAAGLENDSGTVPATPADVINLSIGSTGYSQAEQDAVSAARAAGVIVVAAGGNTGTNTTIFPAGYAGVVGVGAVALDRSRAPYSTIGTHIDLVAPGGNLAADLDGNGIPDGILGTLANDRDGSLVYGYDFYQGTSMAAPHVAAAAAMMRSLLPGLTPANFDSLLAAGELTRDLGATGRDDEYGMGLLDAGKALLATGTVSATPATPVASPSRLSLGATATQALVVIDNGGGGTLTVTGQVTDQPWLAVTPQSVDANGLGSYRIDIDRNGLADGNYSGTVNFNTDAGALAVPVSMIVDATVPASAAGTLYVVVWDPVARQAVPFANNPPFAPDAPSFDLGSVDAGNYQIYIGTDNDNDGAICDPGEACGAWPSLNEPWTFAHVRDRTDIGFTVGYAASLGTLSTGVVTIPPEGIPRR